MSADAVTTGWPTQLGQEFWLYIATLFPRRDSRCIPGMGPDGGGGEKNHSYISAARLMGQEFWPDIVRSPILAIKE
jgi:hypothetical protein